MFGYPFNGAARRAGSGVNAPLDKSGRTALHLAVEKNDIAEIEKLARVGANPNQPDNNGQGAIFEAIARKRPHIIELLVEKGAKLDCTDDKRRTPLDWALEQKCDLETVALLVRLGAPLEDNQKRTPLHAAADLNRADVVEFFARAGFNINAQDNSGRAPIHNAVAAKSLDVITKLIELGADAQRRDNDIRTPLHLAAAVGYDEGADALLALPEVARSVNNHRTYSVGFTPLMEAVNANKPSVAAKIAAVGGDVNQTDNQNRNSLYIAVEQGSVDCTRLLLNLGADASKSTGAGYNKTPMVQMINTKNYRETLMLLYQAGFDLDAKDSTGATALHKACEGQDALKIKALLDLGADANTVNGYGRRPLDVVLEHYTYSYNEQLEIVTTLLDRGASPNLSPNPAIQQAPLHLAARNGNMKSLQAFVARGATVDQPDRSRDAVTPFMAAADNGRDDAAHFLLKSGADAHRTDLQGRNGLHYAAAGGANKLLATLLADPAANVELADNAGMTPLHHAAKRDKKDAVATLLKAGADPLAKDKNGSTPLHLAVEHTYNTDVIEALAKNATKMDWNARDNNGDAPLHVAVRNNQNISIEKLVQVGADPVAQGQHGMIPAQLALLSGNDWGAGILLDAMKKNGTSPDVHRDKNGWALMHYAATRGGHEHLRKLVEMAGDVNIASHSGDTPLHIAARTGQLDGASYLVSMGAKVDAANAAGETPFDIAVKMQRREIAMMLAGELQKIAANQNQPQQKDDGPPEEPKAPRIKPPAP
jgi:cytohesin